MTATRYLYLLPVFIFCLCFGKTVSAQTCGTIPFTLTTVGTDVTCAGSSDGTASISVSGGVGPFTYVWSPGNQTTASITGQPAGTYLCVVTDQGQSQVCTGQVVIGTPSALSYTANSYDDTCMTAVGELHLFGAGGVPPYQYSIDGGATYHVSGVFTGLLAGSYPIVVQDANGCLNNNAEVVQNASNLIVTSVVQDDTCSASVGTITFNVTNGTPPYVYDIGLTPQATPSFTGLTGATYTYQITDNGGCAANGVIVVPTDAGSLASNTLQTHPTCSNTCDGDATVLALGGTPPYTIDWFDSNLNIVGNTLTITGLCPDVYQAVITDANGCQSQSFTTIIAPPAIFYSANSYDDTCSNSVGELHVFGGGGVAPYSYSIDGGVTYVSSGIFTNLLAGSYPVAVMDANGCITNGIEVVGNSSSMVVTTFVEADTCSASVGDVIFGVTLGTPPYTYDLNGTVQASPTFNNLLAGSYSYTITDAASCVSMGNLTISNSGGNVFGTVSTMHHVSCFGDCDGDITLVPGGGVAPYTIDWLDGNFNTIGTTFTITNLCPDVYQALIYDANGCMGQLAVTVGEPAELTIAASGGNASACGACDGFATVTPMGGTPSYQYLWSTAETTPTINACAGFMYHVYVVDGNGCVSNLDSVYVGPDSTYAMVAQIPIVCDDAAPITMSAANPGGVWSASCGSCINSTTGVVDVAVAGPGTHTITYDYLGCTDSEPLTIYPTPAVDISQYLSSCGQCDGQFNSVVTGGTVPYFYQWTPGTGLSNTNIGDPLYCEPANPLTYQLTVVDVNGCVAQDFDIVFPGAACDSVYPGDTDYDGFADNNDLLPIGLTYGATGTVRAGASLNWVGQVSANWLDSIPGGIDYKHSDTNGDAQIDDNDTLAILTNYGYVHSGSSNLHKAGANDPDLYFDLSLDTVGTMAPVTVPLFYGTMNIPVDSAYGLAFTINFDPALVDTTQPITMDFSNSWFGNDGVDALSIEYLMESQGELDVAFTRIDHNPMSGYGLFGELNVVTTDNLSGLVEAEYGNLYFWISDVRVINEVGEELFVNVVEDTLVIVDVSSGMANIALDQALQVYPNPTKDRVIVNLANGGAADHIRVLDLTGRLILDEQPSSAQTHLQLGALSSGSYLLQVERKGSIATRRIEVIR